MSKTEAVSNADTVRNAFLNKKPDFKKIPLTVNGEEVTLVVKPIKEVTLREIRAENPPSKYDKERNLLYNSLSFPPALMAHAAVEPKLSKEEWEEIWESDAWSAGELRDLFELTLEASLKGFDISFGENDSEKTGS